MADVIDLANDRADLDLRLALAAVRPTRLQRIYATLRPEHVCHNCGEPIASGSALFCDYIAPGEDRPACAIDFDRRHGGAA